MMLNTRATSPAVASSAPPVSTRGAPGWEDSGTKRIVPAIATTARTTLTAKAARQENHSSRIPVHSRPSTELPPATPAQMPTARVRSAGGNVPVIVDSVAGITSAAPRPIRPRRTMRSFAEETAIAAAEAVPNTTSPAMSALRRP